VFVGDEEAQSAVTCRHGSAPQRGDPVVAAELVERAIDDQPEVPAMVRSTLLTGDIV
jgi:hypothetical protein